MLGCPVESLFYLITLDIQKLKRMGTNRRIWGVYNIWKATESKIFMHHNISNLQNNTCFFKNVLCGSETPN